MAGRAPETIVCASAYLGYTRITLAITVVACLVAEPLGAQPFCGQPAPAPDAGCVPTIPFAERLSFENLPRRGRRSCPPRCRLTHTGRTRGNTRRATRCCRARLPPPRPPSSPDAAARVHVPRRPTPAVHAGVGRLRGGVSGEAAATAARPAHRLGAHAPSPPLFLALPASDRALAPPQSIARPALCGADSAHTRGAGCFFAASLTGLRA